MALPQRLRYPEAAMPGSLETEVLAFAKACADPHIGTRAAIEMYHRVIAMAGYRHAVAAGAVTLDDFLMPQRFYFNTLPRGWMALLARNKDIYAAGLNGSRRAAQQMEPFESLSLQRGRKLVGHEKKAFDLTIGYGWRSIFMVPVFGPMGYRAGVAIFSKDAISLDPGMRAALRLAALSIHDRCRADEKLGQSTLPGGALTQREIACLREVAAGASDKDIARTLAIKPSTVHDHIERARRKLEARTRAQAAAMLVLRGLA